MRWLIVVSVLLLVPSASAAAQALIRRFLSDKDVEDRRIAGPPLRFEPIPAPPGSPALSP